MTRVSLSVVSRRPRVAARRIVPTCAVVLGGLLAIACDRAPARTDAAQPEVAVAPAGRPSATRTLVVWPFGDSITRGKREFPSYRYFLERDARAAGVTIDFVGTLRGAGGSMAGAREYDAARFPEFADLDHDGHPDQEIGELAAVFDELAARVPAPEVVLVLMGTNDAYHGVPLARSLAEARAFIPRIQARFEGARVVAALPPPIAIDSGREAIEALRGPLGDVYRSFGLEPIDLADGWRPEFLHPDGLHTNARGDAFIASRFAERLGWPTAPGAPR